MSSKDDKTNNQKTYLIIAVVSILIMLILALFAIISSKEDTSVKKNNQSSLFKNNKNIYSLYKLNDQQLSSEIDDYINGRTNYDGTDKAIQKEFISLFIRRNNINLLDKLLTKCSEKNILIKDQDYYDDVYWTLSDNHLDCFYVFEKYGLDFNIFFNKLSKQEQEEFLKEINPQNVEKLL